LVHDWSMFPAGGHFDRSSRAAHRPMPRSAGQLVRRRTSEGEFPLHENNYLAQKIKRVGGQFVATVAFIMACDPSPVGG
jgi:hypothetical protein